MFNLQILQRLSNSSFLTLTRDKFGQIIDHNFIFVSAHNKQKTGKNISNRFEKKLLVTRKKRIIVTVEAQLSRREKYSLAEL
jgi:hypothetical protein